jgi:hypothetical protein
MPRIWLIAVFPGLLTWDGQPKPAYRAYKRAR